MQTSTWRIRGITKETSLGTSCRVSDVPVIVKARSFHFQFISVKRMKNPVPITLRARGSQKTTVITGHLPVEVAGAAGCQVMSLRMSKILYSAPVLAQTFLMIVTTSTGVLIVPS